MAEELGLGFAGIGFQPKWSVAETPIMPKVDPFSTTSSSNGNDELVFDEDTELSSHEESHVLLLSDLTWDLVYVVILLSLLTDAESVFQLLVVCARKAGGIISWVPFGSLVNVLQFLETGQV